MTVPGSNPQQGKTSIGNHHVFVEADLNQKAAISIIQIELILLCTTGLRMSRVLISINNSRPGRCGTLGKASKLLHPDQNRPKPSFEKDANWVGHVVAKRRYPDTIAVPGFTNSVALGRWGKLMPVSAGPLELCPALGLNAAEKFLCGQ